HEWGKVEDGDLRVGITDYAQEELGDIVFVDLLPEGTAVSRGDSVGTVESVKAVSEVYAPVDGEITEVNPALEDAPELVNQDPYGKAWMVVIRMTDPSAARSLMDSRAYEEYVKAEAK
ncbi:MAG TPA: glycine cleavage system protein GcvH, partial [Deltaproteobacteria bacterium]|nr:glycine cleavage system protein GcvH [Deltaproteobacteria bacterium]